ncbi:MAG: ArsA family ATPase [Chloroherpetonaceae bacterium]|nr:ArsA family ATPase [Chloroherpetonaceae bacterium]MDW8437372.1 ArsA family ATPase [Chloroherpetonaceae bacterium]
MFETQRLVFVGGKGGVGKTTVACALGIHLSERFKTLLVSTDPAHSVSDSLQRRIGDRVANVDGVDRLFALELNAERLYRDFLAQKRDQLKRLMDTTTNFDDEDIDAMLETTIPGLDEVMGLKSIADFALQDEWEKVVVDTAPTGHALRLLAMPDLLDDWIKVMAKLRWKYREVMLAFKGAYEPDSADDLLVEMKKTVKRIETLLRDSSRCEFLPVTILAEMAIAETERLAKTLSDYGVAARFLVLNQVLNETHDGAFFQKRKAEQERFKARIRASFPTLRLIEIPLYAEEVKGLDALRSVAEILAAIGS